MRGKTGVLAAALSLAFLAGCAGGDAKSEYYVEYLNKEKTAIVQTPYEPAATETEDLIAEFLTALGTDPEDVNYRRTIPAEVDVTDYSLDGALLSLYFDADYSSMTEVEEVLCRAAVVRTMTQISGVDCVAFYVDGVPLSDDTGELVGTMYAESFVENPGEQINSIQNTVLTLYFSDESGHALVKETRKVHYSSNISMEKLIMEQLLAGPQEDGAKSAIPSGTKLMNVSLVDGVCYVSLDATFQNQDYSIDEQIVMYSIIDSLTELSTISKVQISVNGDTSGVYRDSFKLADMYDRNLDYVADLMSDGTVGTTEATEETEKGE